MTNINEALLRDTSIVFVEPIDTKLKCFICNNILVDAHIATCLHRFCKSCIHNHLENSVDKKCIGANPKCLQTELSMSNSRVLTRSFEINDQIENLLVYCKLSGCEKVIPLEDLENHLNTCDFRIVTCRYQNLGCTTQNIMSNELETHLNEQVINHGILICDELEKNKNCNDNTVQEIINHENVFKDEIFEFRNSLEKRVNELEGLMELKFFNLQAATHNQIENLEKATESIRQENKTLKDQLKQTENKLKKIIKQTEAQKEELAQFKIPLEPNIEIEQKKDVFRGRFHRGRYGRGERTRPYR